MRSGEEFLNEHALETYKSLIQISLQSMKLLALLNGGAAVALLAYLGNIAGKGAASPNMRGPMTCYLIGLVLCGLTFMVGYLTQFSLYNEDIGDFRRGRHKAFLWVAALALGVGSLAAFSVGSYAAVSGFQSVQPFPSLGGI